MTDKGAPLVAMLDTKIMNKEIKVYLQSLMRDMFQNYVEELIQGIFKIPLEECLTTDCFRNITIQELTDVLKDQSKEKLVNPSKNDGNYSILMIFLLLNKSKKHLKKNPLKAKCVLTFIHIELH